MSGVPETKYAKSGDISIAYQVVGDGPIDVVLVPGQSHHVEFMHELPGYSRFINQLTSFARVITFDKRGSGLSDPIVGSPSLEERMDDIRAVMDTVGSERAALFGWSDGAPMALLFAATYPDRTTSLVLYNTFARMLRAEGYPAGIPPEEFKEMAGSMVESWGQASRVEILNPSVPWGPESRSLWAKFERLCISPGALRASVELAGEIDVRSILPAIRVPTLVLHRRESSLVPAAASQYVADSIPNARFVQLEGGDYWPFLGDTESMLVEVEEFITGERHAVVGTDRVLATVLFTDIVASTERAAQVGDHQWRQLLDSHDQVTARQLARFRGSLVKNTGDGVLATFDGPARAINCAVAIREAVRALGLETCAGLHTGEVEKRGTDIGGIAVHIAARVLEKAQPGEVLVSRTLTDLVAGSGLSFEDRGEHELQGIANKWQLFAATT